MLNPLKIGQRSQNTPETTSSKEEKILPDQQQKNLSQKPDEVSSPPSSTIEAAPDWASDLGVERGTAEEAEAEALGLQTQAAMLDQESFHKVFCGGFTAVGHMTGLESLKVDEQDEKAVACTNALYETILDVPMLHFLLMPQSKWLGRAVAIGMFTLPMVNNVKIEIEAKAQAAKKDDPEPSPAATQASRKSEESMKKESHQPQPIIEAV